MDELKLEAEAKTFVRAPRERVYDAFATANSLNGWFTKGAEVDAKPGGMMVFRFENWGPEHNINESFPEPRPSRSSSRRGARERWSACASSASRTRPRGGSQCSANAEGWGEVAILVKFYLEHGLVYESAGH